MQLSPNLLTVSSPMGANTASHEEQHYLWASVSKGKLAVVVFKHDLIAKRISLHLLSWTDFKGRFVPLAVAIFPLSNQLCDCSQLTSLKSCLECNSF